jgi:hypothetical protein
MKKFTKNRRKKAATRMTLCSPFLHRSPSGPPCSHVQVGS